MAKDIKSNAIKGKIAGKENLKETTTHDVFKEADSSATSTDKNPGDIPTLDPTRYGDWIKNGRAIDF
jgi:hypothetical protein